VGVEIDRGAGVRFGKTAILENKYYGICVQLYIFLFLLYSIPNYKLSWLFEIRQHKSRCMAKAVSRKATTTYNLEWSRIVIYDR
jgi:hypothetical protein